jgi:hydrophobic/amphiphilic exporter-1 (mainly G- bacteria), HAE1 family
MAALGFTVNLSTLFALVLSIGIVVDDAIVVVEAASAHLERGMSAHDAAIQAMKELFGPIIGITLVLVSCSCRRPSCPASPARCTRSSRW